MKKIHTKIQDIFKLSDILKNHKLNGQKIVLCHGVFDLLHIGHIKYFEEAKSSGDILIVTITPDKYVNKGPHRPAFSETLRAEAIASLDCVDFVAINQWPTAIETIKTLNIDIYAKGPDYKDPNNDITGNISKEEDAVKSIGGKIIFTDDIIFSSSNLINKYISIYDPKIKDYLNEISNKFSIETINSYLENSKSLNVLVIGETIIDEYQYGELMGKTSKEPILATKATTSEKFAGGVIAVANHVADFSNKVTLVSTLGSYNTQEKFITSNLKTNINPKFIYKENSPTIVKRRFLEAQLIQKLFEVYEMNDEELTNTQDTQLCSLLEEIVPSQDLVIVVDYGHGMLTSNAINILNNQSKYLAVNTQANAGNRGINPISRYKKVNYTSFASHEIAIEARKRSGDIKELIKHISSQLSCELITVTRGKDGSISYNDKEGFIESPALSNQVIDRMGAGDSVLAITALCAAQKAPLEILSFIGNVAGAQAVATLGHSKSISKENLIKHINSLLK